MGYAQIDKTTGELIGWQENANPTTLSAIVGDNVEIHEMDRATMEAMSSQHVKSYDELRREEYPPVGDQLDAIWKLIESDRAGGKSLPKDASDILDAVAAVKIKYPKS